MTSLEEFAAMHSRDGRCKACKLPLEVLEQAQAGYAKGIKPPTIRNWLMTEHGLPDMNESSMSLHLRTHERRWRDQSNA